MDIIDHPNTRTPRVTPALNDPILTSLEQYWSYDWIWCFGGLKVGGVSG